MRIFGERLGNLRRQKKVTQVQMSVILGCSEQHYQRFEYGKINVQMMTLIALADYFDVSLDYLVGRSDDPKRY